MRFVASSWPNCLSPLQSWKASLWKGQGAFEWINNQAPILSVGTFTEVRPRDRLGRRVSHRLHVDCMAPDATVLFHLKLWSKDEILCHRNMRLIMFDYHIIQKINYDMILLILFNPYNLKSFIHYIPHNWIRLYIIVWWKWMKMVCFFWITVIQPLQIS